MKSPAFLNSIRNYCKKNKTVCLLLIILIVIGIIFLTRRDASGHPSPNTVFLEGFQGTVEVSSVDQLVPASDEVIVVFFYTNWCGYCKRFKPKFNELLTKLEAINNNRSNGRVSLKMVNCEDHKAICGRNGINAYPTLKVYRPSTIDSQPTGEADVVTPSNITEQLLTELEL
jgi:thiol-disulfide isomerase/thioredoxin